MKTDDLINLLGTNVEPVKNGQLQNTIFVALGLGGAAALCLTLLVLGPPEGALGARSLGQQILGLSFAVGLIAAGTSFLLKAARPGKPGRRPLIIIGLLFVLIVAAGIIAFATSSPSSWGGLIFGAQWAACLLCVPLFAALPFASLVWALRKEAPTNLAWTGAAVGIVAGALGVAAYALHHPVDSIPFVAIWYGGPILLCALVGALLGPRLLRW
jgi:hypothetical protein